MEGDTGDDIKADILADYAKANIYIRTLDVQSIVENAKYTVCVTEVFIKICPGFGIQKGILSQADGFAAGLGGALSLFMGIAIVMVFELIELLADLFVDGISSDEAMKRKAKKTTP